MERLINADMKEYTSFRAGGRADLMLIPETMEELRSALRETAESGTDFVLLGNGSNTLVRDEGFHGTIIHLGTGFSAVETEGKRMRCGAAALMSAVADAAMKSGLGGFENISGIPGSIGGAVFMDAGAYGTEIRDVIVSAEAVRRDGSGVYTVTVEDMDLSYRHSHFQETGDIVTSVVIELEPADPQSISGKMKEMAEKRNSKQPVQYPSAGSFFKRPEGHFAGKLIQDAGLKGVMVGGAQVSEQHAGFIINRGGATASDILDLMHLVQNAVYDQFGVRLEPEVRIIGG